MRRIGRIDSFIPAFVLLGSLTGCVEEPQGWETDSRFPKGYHPLLPETPAESGQVATGPASDKALDQPIKFPHYTHATTLEMDCQFCHADARRSIHGGVPATQVCMNCHKFVKADAPEIVKLKEYHEKGESPPWNKVHDLPDYVVFNHSRHITGGVECTECHGNVAEQGKPEKVMKQMPDGTTQEVLEVKEVMKREKTLQMGWCLDCHGSHPSVDKNYGDSADLRRAELKDCWTCHK